MSARPGLRLLAAATLLAARPVLAADAVARVEAPSFSEVQEHRIEPEPKVETAWADLTADASILTWQFDLTVDERGSVSAARLVSGSRSYRDAAARTALTIRFKPFIHDGKPVAARFTHTLVSRHADYAGPKARGFPEHPDPASTVIALSRSSCYGTCPDYRVEIRGDGEVRYRGNYDVLVPGEHRWHIDPAQVQTLLELFRRADFFALDGYYEYPISDIPTYVTRLSIDDRHKFVLDYGGGGLGGAFAATVMPGQIPAMPDLVSQIERAIDKAADVYSFVSGDDTTVQKLQDAHWNFHSREAGDGLRQLLAHCDLDLAREFIRAGAPVDVEGSGFGAGLPVALATYCGDVDLVRRMLDRGALHGLANARTFLAASANSGNPALVTLALKHFRNVNIKDSDGVSLLASVAGSYANRDSPGAATFDSARIVEMLVDAGANPNARDHSGRTPLFEANDARVVNALLRKGADPNVRDDEGQTALFGRYFADARIALIAAGTDVRVRDRSGRTALFFQEEPEAIEALLKAGAALDAVDTNGQTAVEQMTSEQATTALLAAGAKLPDDTALLDAMIAKARAKNWSGVLTRLQAAARK